jgi:hypothetical protein
VEPPLLFRPCSTFPPTLCPPPPPRSKSLVDELRPELPERSKKAQVPYCVCLAWSADGSTLYSGAWGAGGRWKLGRHVARSCIVPSMCVLWGKRGGAVLHAGPAGCAPITRQSMPSCWPSSSPAPARWPPPHSTPTPPPHTPLRYASAGYTDGAIRVWQVGRAI